MTIIYTALAVLKLPLKHSLRRRKKSEIEILNQFQPQTGNTKTFSSVIICADLMTSTNVLNIETAGIIYKHFGNKIVKKFE